MNALKHMEAIFLAAVVVIGMSAIASDVIASAPAAKNANGANSSMVSVAGDGKMAVVTISAKRPVAVAKAG
ncbi:hypothetical protein [Massilia glaciei]|uniref:Uncharacterized protein n=1 Tax=Massilia glaciei TaxID=1524097 RepID=A0A2U2HMN6_9BURK|nr:hypothetical protein [Massilia glaciei]PWF48778.1 hypothetical protein C7C56_009895 [Massilia glaciei]